MRGSSAWRLKSYQGSVSMEYERNPDWYDSDKVNPDGIEYHIIPEYATGLAQFKAGNLHTWAVRAADVLNLKSEAKEINLYQGEYNAPTLNTAFGYKPGSLPNASRNTRIGHPCCARAAWMH